MKDTLTREIDIAEQNVAKILTDPSPESTHRALSSVVLALRETQARLHANDEMAAAR